MRVRALLEIDHFGLAVAMAGYLPVVADGVNPAASQGEGLCPRHFLVAAVNVAVNQNGIAGE